MHLKGAAVRQMEEGKILIFLVTYSELEAVVQWIGIQLYFGLKVEALTYGIMKWCCRESFPLLKGYKSFVCESVDDEEYRAT